MSSRPCRSIRADEAGAALVLALVFMVSVGLLIGVLVNLVETNLLATSSLSEQRALEQAADGALEIAVQTVRYNPPTCTLPHVVEFTAAQLRTNFGYGGTSDLQVLCTAAGPTGERQVTLCAGPLSMASCSASPSPDEYARAQVLYVDVTPSCAPNCTSGASVTIESWTVDPAGH
jgi:hypothetical protein